LLYSYFGSSAGDPCLACVKTFGPKLRTHLLQPLDIGIFQPLKDWHCDGEDQARAQRYNGVYLKNIKLQREEVESRGANIHLLAKSLVSRS
jgi:hypothetical protein